MMSSQEAPVSPVVREAVVSWTGEEKENCLQVRGPVLPDLRSGAGFTVVVWLHLGPDLSQGPDHSRPLPLVDGMSRVSGSLGEI